MANNSSIAFYDFLVSASAIKTFLSYFLVNSGMFSFKTLVLGVTPEYYLNFSSEGSFVSNYFSAYANVSAFVSTLPFT